ncbi:Tim10/DDP family zinc finger protein [Sodiomyces alkalinus F11]|uniref:Mitochondrial import inner membrane translocase subunit n=1 Tax=Sodiomyces alkalinus (strain CBS 110278 / VKM F-3762 / F11) TaxID=1314773 RepID=A0A3N2PYG5_SODAK|nr:Tim10/DDP family zinc finger protein [Sodiomyces alkalinus F11]ROT39522.1 Tim10/DDP family zinc finger protein [Sodiomyces alkalinus F11]
MSFLGFGRPKLSSEEKVAMAEQELRMLASMHNRMTKMCQTKCIPDYREGELNKGESVCLDRCSAKYFESHQKVSDIMQAESQKRGPAQGGAMF